MIPVVWTRPALADLEAILTYVAERSPQGAATIASRVRLAQDVIARFPRAARCDTETGLYEAVVSRVPLILVYEILKGEDGERVEILAAFHASRDPTEKPKRRSDA